MSLSNPTNKVLLLGASTQSCVFVAKQLKSIGLHVTVIDWHRVPVYESRYVDVYFDFSSKSPKSDIRVFAEAVLANIQQNEYDAVIPIHDPAVEFCICYYNELSKLVRLPGVNAGESYEYAHNKHKLLVLASELGLATPKTIMIQSLEDIDLVPADWAYPCVVKPVSSSVVFNHRILEFKVCFANNREELIDYVREHVLLIPVMIQEKVTGYGIGYNILSKDGAILSSYIHRRLNEKNGVSSYRESVPVETDGLQKRVEAMIERIGWTGVAMVEFKVDNDRCVLMEMNGRFWGSIEVAIRSGLNFPVWLYDLSTRQKLPSLNGEYKLVRVRNLHRETIEHFELLKSGNIRSFLVWLWSLRSMTDRNEYTEDNLFKDPRFVLRLYANDFLRNIRKALFVFKHAPHPVASFGNDNGTIAFVCAGNICRSPFAELVARKLYQEKKFVSFGTVDHSARQSPMNALAAAQKFNIDLSQFKSTSHYDLNLTAIDRFVVMDTHNYESLIKIGVSHDRIFFLASSDIPDPYMKDESFFAGVYQQIYNSISTSLFRK